ncbi:DUF6297 family protein [Haloechinothrix sp. LS1_15]|uniref:DUF6297 family protein n=1 Tax=Haloechinothrix sp. LS1_15 TaxID=2652248 RepID=UPI00294625C6|nr:DUF6297 family protein [Haloechinothrix sp. LS1_15]MDV6014759.1 hypothetical protein [Haloechinothrix sp. LS1_15]
MTSHAAGAWRFTLARWYERFLYLAVFGAISYELVLNAIGRDVSDHQLAETGLSGWALGWLTLIAGIVFVKVILAFGPLFASAERVFWVISSPVDRTSLLLPKFVVVVGLGAVAGVVWPAAVLGITGPPSGPTLVLFAGSAALGVALAASGVIVQGTRLRVHRMQLWLSSLMALAALTLLVGLLSQAVASGVTAPLATFGGDLALVTALIAAAAGLALGYRMLRRIRRASLSTGSALASAVATSISWFELNLLGSLLLKRRALLQGAVRSVRLRGSRVAVLVWADLVRTFRARNSLLIWGALIPVPILVSISGVSDLVPVVQLVAAFLATDRLAGGLRFVCRSPGIRRMLGIPERTLRLAHLIVPAAGAILWCAVTVPLVPEISVLHGTVSALGAIAVVYRIATRPPREFGGGATDFGLIGPTPIGLVIQLFRGPALLLVLGGLQLALP